MDVRDDLTTEELFESFKLTSEASKLLITLSTAIVGGTTALLTVLPRPTSGLLILTWSLHFLSILFGVMFVNKLAGNLLTRPAMPDRSPYQSGSRWLAFLQYVTFLLGILALVVVGALAL